MTTSPAPTESPSETPISDTVPSTSDAILFPSSWLLGLEEYLQIGLCLPQPPEF